jgi:osmotically-inducible protein OsmY
LGVTRGELTKQAVKDCFYYDPRIHSYHPNIDVKNGTVTLSGVVEGLKAKRSAEADARNVLGVRRVKNNLKVRPNKIPTNDVLKKRISRALIFNPIVESWEIEVKVVSGTVYLSGEVGSWYEKYMADNVTVNVKGVVNVVNNITYPGGWLYKSDSELLEDVKDELFWSPFVDHEDVGVTVFKGVVTLTGNVDTWSERQSAEKNADEAGAKSVVNNLTVTHQYFGPFAHHFHYHPYWYGYHGFYNYHYRSY